MNRQRNGYRYVSPSVFIITVTLLLFSSVSLISRILRINPKNDWDILIFTQNWPVTTCLAWQDECKKNTCTFPNDTAKWTIHGIWPTKVGTLGPWFCNLSLPFNIEAIYGLEPELEQKWTPVQNHKKKHMLWKHEWEKHGTCAAALPALGSEFKYFAQGLDWFDKYQMEMVLDKAGIKPGNQAFDVQKIWESIGSVLGKRPFIMCYDDQKSDVSYLQEIRICFNKNLTLIDCDGIQQTKWGVHVNNSLIQCPLQKPTMYLTSLPQRTDALNHREPKVITFIKALQLLQWITL